MDIRDKLHLVIYRVRERGLEIFVRDDADAAEQLTLPEGNADFDLDELERLREEIIALDEGETGEDTERGIAIEADYHDIPSLKGLLLEDAREIKRRLVEEEGAFVAVKEVAKRLLPGQYKLLSELRDILVDRNSTKYM